MGHWREVRGLGQGYCPSTSDLPLPSVPACGWHQVLPDRGDGEHSLPEECGDGRPHGPHHLPPGRRSTGGGNIPAPPDPQVGQLELVWPARLSLSQPPMTQPQVKVAQCREETGASP